MADDASVNLRPTPDDFYNYLPWACNQLQLYCTVIPIKVYQNEYVSVVADKGKKPRPKPAQIRDDDTSDQDKDETSASGLGAHGVCDPNVVKISLVYDSFDNLVEIKLEKNKHIPRPLVELIALVMPFQPYVTRIVIDGGLDMFTIYGIGKFINTSNITEIILDNSFLKEANYDIVLEGPNSLRHLSLSKCKINDQVLENIASKLMYPLPASKTLSILNLSSNRITDEGAKYLAEVLRVNRHLSYLSLADNRLTDDGASLILNNFLEFPLTCEEIITARQRHMKFLKTKNALINSIINELKSGEFDRKLMKKKSIRPSVAPSKRFKVEKESSAKALGDSSGDGNVEMMLFYEKATIIAEDRLGKFNDPYSTDNINVKDGSIYCIGNNALCCLNLAYNNLSYISLKKLLSVLLYQRQLDRRPSGLVNISVEGNNLPVTCNELSQIDDILESGLMIHNRRLSTAKKKPPSARMTPH